MQAPDWYDAWCEEAFDAFRGKQQRLMDTYRLSSWERYDYDASAGTLTFSEGGRPRVIADMLVLGTIANDWLWGWANENWPAQSTDGLKPVRDFGAQHGVEELTTEYLESDDLEGLGWMLAAIAARILDAEGAYRAPTENGAVYLVLRSLKFVS
jgi:formylglycine-generating enzyme required for sulfatase activity